MNEFQKNAKGYLLALVLCAGALWVGGYVAYRSNRTAEEVSVTETYTDLVLGTQQAENVPAIATNPQNGTGGKVPETVQNSAETAPNSTETVPKSVQQQPLKTMAPVSGSALCDYSMEALSYNQTTRDWRVHDGIDLAAEAGAEVVAAADGEVYAVFEDDALGHTVVIRHTDGYATTYASLAKDILVQPGDAVTMGQAIGCADRTAITEQALGSHVHFAVAQYEKTVDPEAFLALGK